jgi:hypothetical protein
MLDKNDNIAYVAFFSFPNQLQETSYCCISLYFSDSIAFNRTNL